MFNDGDVLYKQKANANQARNRPKDFLYTEQKLKTTKLSARAICRWKNNKKTLKMQKTNKNFIKRKTVIT
jgi:hypothetical protein